DAWICRPGMTQEQATILITEAFWALKERPNIDVQRVTYEGGAIDQRALGVIWSSPDGEIRRYDSRLNIICRECRKSEVMQRILAFYQGNFQDVAQ
ncbi:DUF977 family protein, partial [Escherichia coli]|uniref:DUF977 family protein n=4 Tax=Escherichia coli TaxID=562 RepID=UPI001555CC11